MDKATSLSKELGLHQSALDPVSRASEILFGLIMVLTFTCSLSVAEVGRDDVRQMLIGALGCNIAWGVIDAFFYLMNVATQKGRERLLLSKLKEVSDQSSVEKLFEGFIPENLVGSLTPKSFSEVRDHVLQRENNGTILSGSDFKAAFIIFVLVFLTTFPVAVPFLLTQNTAFALRLSNLIALLLLFGIGFSLGRYAGRRPLLWGICMTVIGVALVAMTIALGG